MKSVRIALKEAKTGMVVADDIYNFSNQLVIAKNTELTDKIIIRLKFYSIQDILILEKSGNETVYNNYSQKIKMSTEFKSFNNSFLTAIPDLKSDFGDIVNNNEPIDTSKLISQVNTIIAESRNGLHIFDMLHCMREYDDLTYIHSVNVSLICNVLGKWLNFSSEDLEILTLSGLLHDIGKLKMPSEIINKKTPLTQAEYSVIKSHTIYGYQILKNEKIDERIKHAVLMHHERCDGSGYPNKFHGNNISSFAKIVAIADVYDAMTSNRIYRPALCPFEAIENFESDGLKKYDPLYIMTFLEGICQSYIGNQVRLSNNQVGEIIMINKNCLSKPVVQIDDEFLDLAKDHDLYIEAFL